MEPFLVNAPRKRRRRARRRGGLRGHKRGCKCVVHRRRHSTRRRRHRRNPYATLAGGNPPMARKRRHSRRRGGRRRHSRRRYHRNPGGGGGSLMSQVKQAVAPVGWGVVGYAGTTVIPGLASKFLPVPTKDSNMAGYYLVKAGAAVGAGWAVGKFVNKKAGFYVLVGGGLTIAAELFNQFVGPYIGLSDYLSPGENVSAYLDESGQVMGYLGPGQSVADLTEIAEPIERLNPEKRF